MKYCSYNKHWAADSEFGTHHYCKNCRREYGKQMKRRYYKNPRVISERGLIDDKNIAWLYKIAGLLNTDVKTLINIIITDYEEVFDTADKDDSSGLLHYLELKLSPE